MSLNNDPKIPQASWWEEGGVTNEDDAAAVALLRSRPAVGQIYWLFNLFAINFQMFKPCQNYPGIFIVFRTWWSRNVLTQCSQSMLACEIIICPPTSCAGFAQHTCAWFPKVIWFGHPLKRCPFPCSSYEILMILHVPLIGKTMGGPNSRQKRQDCGTEIHTSHCAAHSRQLSLPLHLRWSSIPVWMGIYVSNMYMCIYIIMFV